MDYQPAPPAKLLTVPPAIKMELALHAIQDSPFSATDSVASPATSAIVISVKPVMSVVSAVPTLPSAMPHNAHNALSLLA